MTTYYISPYGSDAGGTGGLGPDPRHPSLRPWLTIGQALSTAGVVGGDTVKICPGIYYQAGAVTVAASVGSAGSPSNWEGDPLNASGFRDKLGNLVPPGPILFTTRSVADGLIAHTTAANLLNLQTNNVKGLTFRNMILEAKQDNAAAVVGFSPAASSDILFEDCRLLANSIISFNNVAPTATRNLTLRRCVMVAGQVFVSSIATAAATADADLTILVEHCRIYGRIFAGALGTSAGNLAGGMRFKGNLCLNASAQSLAPTAARVSLVTPIRVEGNIFVAQGIAGGTLGQIVSDGYNVYVDIGTSSNFTKAGTDFTSPYLAFHDADLVKWGLALPTAAPFFGWTADAAPTILNSGWTNTGADFRGRTPRPWAAGASIGPTEYGGVSQDSGSKITGGGATSLKLTGAGETAFYIPVDAVPTTITIVTESTGYGGANYPQMILEANPELGLAQQTASATDATEQTLTIGPFTPGKSGVLELRLLSRSSNGTSGTYFDVLQAA